MQCLEEGNRNSEVRERVPKTENRGTEQRK